MVLYSSKVAFLTNIWLEIGLLNVMLSWAITSNTFPGSMGHRSSTHKDILYEISTWIEDVTGLRISTSNGSEPSTDMSAVVLSTWSSRGALAISSLATNSTSSSPGLRTMSKIDSSPKKIEAGLERFNEPNTAPTDGK